MTIDDINKQIAELDPSDNGYRNKMHLLAIAAAAVEFVDTIGETGNVPPDMTIDEENAFDKLKSAIDGGQQ